MICDQCVKEPDLWAECIKNLVTVGSALIVTAYVAMAQFSRQSGEFSELQTKTFFSQIFPPYASAIGFVLLILACGLTTDNAECWMEWWSLVLFAGACYLHGNNLRHMYLWSTGSKTSNTFAGNEPRAVYVRRWLTLQESITAEEKARLVVQHFENAGKSVSREDQRYAVKLFKETTLQIYAKCFPVAIGSDPAAGRAEAFADRLRFMLYRSSQLLGLSDEDVEGWYDPDFIRKLIVGSRNFSDKQCSAVWAVRDHLVWMNARLSEAHQPRDWRLAKYFDAMVKESASDYDVPRKELDDVDALVSQAVFQSIFEAIGRVRFRQRVEVLSPLLDPGNEDSFAIYVRWAFVEFASAAVDRGQAKSDGPLAAFCQVQLPGVSYGHLVRLIKLEKDVLNANADAFMDFCSRFLPGDDNHRIRFPGLLPDPEEASAYKASCDLARRLYMPFARFSRDPKYLEEMKAALIKRRDDAVAANEMHKQARAVAALEFIAEHDELLRKASQPNAQP